MHAYLWAMFVIQVIGVLSQIGSVSSPNTRKKGTVMCLMANIGFLVWTSVLIWS